MDSNLTIPDFPENPSIRRPAIKAYCSIFQIPYLSNYNHLRNDTLKERLINALIEKYAVGDTSLLPDVVRILNLQYCRYINKVAGSFIYSDKPFVTEKKLVSKCDLIHRINQISVDDIETIQTINNFMDSIGVDKLNKFKQLHPNKHVVTFTEQDLIKQNDTRPVEVVRKQIEEQLALAMKNINLGIEKNKVLTIELDD
jgi:hypothetical protein